MTHSCRLPRLRGIARSPVALFRWHQHDCGEARVSEPKAEAMRVAEVLPDIWHWFVWDDRIGAESHAHAVSGEGGSVMIDPLPLREAGLRSLEPIVAICLTAACHQRSAWRYRRACGAKVYAPEGTRDMEEEPDIRYRRATSCRADCRRSTRRVPSARTMRSGAPR